MTTERQALVTPGPEFLRGEGGEVLFRFVIDGGSIIGPRRATERDQREYPGEWLVFCAAEGVSPLDRDAQDGPGGSLPTAEPAPPRKRRGRLPKVSHEPVDDHSGGH